MPLLERRETRAIVRRCIDQLPASCRAVLVLRDIEDLDTEETAGVLGETVSAVKTRLHRVRQALQARLAQAFVAADVDAAGRATGAR